MNSRQGSTPVAADRPVKIAFWGNFGTLNLGNECTLSAAVHNLRVLLPEAQMTAICREPLDTATRHNIKAVPLHGRSRTGERERYSKPVRVLRYLASETIAWAQAFRQAGQLDVLLVTGTGVLSDAGEGPFGLPYELFKWALVTRLRGRRLMFVSVGVESISRPISRFLLKSALRLAHYRCYRDDRSAALLRQIGVRTDRDVVRPDLAFSLPVAAEKNVSVAANNGNKRQAVAIGVFNFLGRGEGSPEAAAAYAAYLDRMVSLVFWLLEQDYAVRLIIGDATYDSPVRLDVLERLQRRGLSLEDPRFSDEPADSFEQLLRQLATVDFVIATRFHNVLLALLLGRPVISLSYEGKNEVLMREMGLGEYCQTLDELDPERLRRQFQRLTSEADALRASVRAKAAANATLLQQQYDLIVSTVRAAGGRR
jgi:polysaccharide pyruvyl transferase WcaK-like protein